MQQVPAVEIVQIVAVTMGVIASLLALAAAARSGLLRRLKLGSFELEMTERESKEARALVNAAAGRPREVPFETEELARYYAQVLAQSRLSFIFSLTFATVGFLVIVSAIRFALWQPASFELGPAALQVAAGTVIDAVAALFFVQSRAAQTSMSEFFSALRRDRLHAEARELVEAISSSHAQDAARMTLALKYAGVSEAEALLRIALNIGPKADHAASPSAVRLADTGTASD
jgi:hypothetical protein